MNNTYITSLLACCAICGKAQTVYNVGDYSIPVGTELRVSNDKGFMFNDKGVEYQFPLDSRIALGNGEPCLPMAVRNNKWLGGYSSLQSQPVIFSKQSGEKFFWRDDNISFSDYQLSGEVIDSVKNVSLGEYSDYFGKKVDIVYLRVKTGETGMVSLPSNTYCAWQETTHVGKIAAIVLSYADCKSTGKILNNAVGVAKWYTSLTEPKGVSGKTYEASATVEYFDDLETAKDVTLNTDNWFRHDGGLGLTAPTWQYMSAGGSLETKTVYDNEELKSYNIGYLNIENTAKPAQSWLDEATAYRFDTPDKTSAIVDFSYSATDPEAEFQYPELRSAGGIPGSQYAKAENNTWVGATCLFLVPKDVQSYSKYRKFDGYLHVTMLNGAKYKRHFNIDKKGIITADETWEKEEEPSRQIATECQDNGEMQYFNMRFAPRYNLQSLPYTKRMASYEEAHATEADVSADYRMSYLPCVDAYLPYSMTTTKPEREMHCCNFSFRAADNAFMQSELKDKGVVLHLSDDIDGTFDSNGYNTWMFTDKQNRIVAYTMSYIGSLLGVEWME